MNTIIYGTGNYVSGRIYCTAERKVKDKHPREKMKWSWIANDGQECELRDGKTSHHHPPFLGHPSRHSCNHPHCTRLWPSRLINEHLVWIPTISVSVASANSLHVICETGEEKWQLLPTGWCWPPAETHTIQSERIAFWSRCSLHWTISQRHMSTKCICRKSSQIFNTLMHNFSVCLWTYRRRMRSWGTKPGMQIHLRPLKVLIHYMCLATTYPWAKITHLQFIYCVALYKSMLSVQFCNM